MPCPSDLHIHAADLDRPDQARAVVDLVDAYARDPMGGGMPLAAPVRERLVRGLRQTPGHLVLLAWVGTDPVGLAVCFQGFSTFHARPLLNIHDLAVLSERRGLGIGRALLAAVESEAIRRGCCKLTLEVREDNPLAERLYRDLGFGSADTADGPVAYRFMEKRLRI